MKIFTKEEKIVLNILTEKFGFSEEKAKKYLKNMYFIFYESIINLMKNGENEKVYNMLKTHIIWDYDLAELAYNRYVKDLDLDENKNYGNLLDIGCAWGEFIEVSKKKGTFLGTKMTGVDNCLNFVEKGQEKRNNLIFMDALELDFEENFFDMVISIGGVPFCLFLENNEEKSIKIISKFFDSVYKILKKGGEYRFVAFPSQYKMIGIIKKIISDKNFSKVDFDDKKERFLCILKK